MTMAAYGAHLERTQTWWDHGAKEFFAYMSRAQRLLQTGTFAGDVLLCVPGEAPEYGTDGEIPEGYDGDRCHPDALSEVKVVEGGSVEVPGGTRYRVLGIPDEMFTPIFAIARMAGWSAHRMEELANMQKIIRPAFKSIMDERPYVPIGDRK